MDKTFVAYCDIVICHIKLSKLKNVLGYIDVIRFLIQSPESNLIGDKALRIGKFDVERKIFRKS